MSPLDAFERRLIFPVSRGLQLLLAGISCLLLALSGLAFAYGVSPTWRGFDPPTPTPTPAAEVVLADLRPTTTDRSDARQPARATPPPASTGRAPPPSYSPPDPVAEIATHFDTSRHPWLDRTSQYCARQGYRGCYRWERRVEMRGARHLLNQTFRDRGAPMTLAQLSGPIFQSLPDDDHRYVFAGVLSRLWQLARIDSAGIARIAAWLGDLEDDDLIAGLNVLAPLGRRHSDASLTPQALDEVLGFVFERGLTPKASDLGEILEALVGAQTHRIQIGEPGLPSVLSAVVDTFEVGERADAIYLWTHKDRARRAEAEAAYEAAIRKHQQASAQRDRDRDATNERKEALRAQAMMWGSGAIGALALLGWLLSILAMERSARRLEQVAVLLSANEPPAPPLANDSPPSPQTPSPESDDLLGDPEATA